MIIDWSMRDIETQINKITWAATDPRMDGFNTWARKKELYHLLWHIEDSLDKCSTYAGEEAFVREREKTKTFNALKGKL